MLSQRVIMLQISDGNRTVVIDTRDYNPKKILRRLSTKIVVGHNMKFDYTVILNNYGVRLLKPKDTMLAEQTLTLGPKKDKGFYTLEQVTRRRFDKFAYTNQLNLFMPAITKKERESFLKITSEPFSLKQIVYGALDAYYTFHIFNILLKELEKNDLLDCFNFECDYTPVLVMMEIEGMPISSDGVAKLGEKLNTKRDALRVELEKIAPINWNSPAQVVKVFKEKDISVDFIDKKTGDIKESVNRLVLEKQQAKSALVALYVEYKDTQTLASRYGLKFLEYINPSTGRIHSSFLQLMNTGRLSSTSPNMQNIPREVEYRENFVCEEGYTFIVADFSNQEGRIIADKSGEKNMIDVFLNNEDLHCKTASLIYKVPITKDDPRRQIGKTTAFLIAYGGGASKLADQFGLSLKEARWVIDEYFKAYPQLKEYFEENFRKTLEQGYVLIDDVIRRKSYLPYFDEFTTLIKAAKREKILFGTVDPRIDNQIGYLSSKYRRISQNFPIQGTAAFMTKKAGILLLKEALKTKKIVIVLKVHDECVVKCKVEYAEEVKVILEKCMLDASKACLTKLDCPAKGVITQKWNK